MVIVFYDPSSNKIYVSSENEKQKQFSLDDQEFFDSIPNDDILFVQTGHFFNKPQFKKFLNGELKVENPRPVVQSSSNDHPVYAGQVDYSNKLFIHPTNNGTIIINDLVDKKNQVVAFRSKWDFKMVDDIGEDALNESHQFQLALKKGKLEFVPYDYVKKNMNKITQKMSPTDRELSRILVPADIKAEAAAEAGGIEGADIATSILIQ